MSGVATIYGLRVKGIWEGFKAMTCVNKQFRVSFLPRLVNRQLQVVVCVVCCVCSCSFAPPVTPDSFFLLSTKRAEQWKTVTMNVWWVC